MAALILLRHASSAWNESDRFAGWEDVRLGKAGLAEATRAGEQLAASGLRPDVLHTSLLTRAIQTANTVLEVTDRAWIPVRRSWRLNERHYGALQGRARGDVLREFGAAQYWAWRRGFTAVPPALEPRASDDDRYRGVRMPAAESLSMVLERLLPYWESAIRPDLVLGRTVLVTAHGNSLRVLVKHLEGIGDADTGCIDIPTGVPIVYHLGVSGWRKAVGCGPSKTGQS